MVLDKNLIRQNPDLIKTELSKRFKNTEICDDVLKLDEDWRKERFNNDEFNRIRNLCSTAIKLKKKAKEDDGDSDEVPQSVLNNLQSLSKEKLSEYTVVQIKRLSKELDNSLQQCAERCKSIKEELDRKISEIPNLLHKDVIISKDEEENGIIRIHGDTTIRKPLSHVDLVMKINGADFDISRHNSGSRSYCLRGPCVALETALITFCQIYQCDNGYELLSPSVFMNKDVMQRVAQLSQYDNELYKVVGKKSELPEDQTEEEKYLIATSEQPMAAFNHDKGIAKSDLPIRYLPTSECFRQEVGSHGRDTRGIFRVHQFKKVEQFCITSPHDGASDEMFKEMMANSENLYQLLGIPYRVVSIVSGELNNAASIKYDLEGWFPGSGAFRELVSCSNCTDYQARSVNLRYGETKLMNQDPEYVHMLNCTYAATTRVLCAIMENYQTDKGIIVPEVLRKHMPKKYNDFIPFVDNN